MTAKYQGSNYPYLGIPAEEQYIFFDKNGQKYWARLVEKPKPKEQKDIMFRYVEDGDNWFLVKGFYYENILNAIH